MTDKLIVEESGSVLRLTLNRPKKHNAIDLDMLEGLRLATQRFAEREDLRVLLLRAEGQHFSAGVDLNSPLGPPTEVKSQAAFRRWYRSGVGSLHPLGDEWEALEKPVVIVHQGLCLGGALELSLCADFRFAATSARYGLPEIALGGIPGSGGTSRLVRLVGTHWARWLILANRQIDAEQALSIGLIHEVIADADLQDYVERFCNDLAKQPAEAFSAGKLAIELAADLDRAQARNVERLAVSGLVVTDEYRQMLSAMKARLAGKK